MNGLMKTASRIAFLILIVLALSGCMRLYNLSPDKHNVKLHHVQQLSIYGPFDDFQIHTGVKQSRLKVSADQAGKLTEVTVEQYGNKLVIKPKRGAKPADIRSIPLQVYVKSLNDLSIDHADKATVYLTPHNQLRLAINNTKEAIIHASPKNQMMLSGNNTNSVLLKGGAVLPALSLENCANFNAVGGALYVNTVHVIGPGKAHLSNIAGGHVSVKAFKQAHVWLAGNTYTLLNIEQGAHSFVHISGKKIKGDDVVLKAQGRHHIYLGSIDFSRLTFQGAGDSTLTIKGYVNELIASLSENSQLRGKHLTVSNAFIKTYDQAVANVHVSRQIFAKAFDQSRIDYSGRPKYRYVYAKDNSAVLPLSGSTPNALKKGGWIIR